MSVGNLFTLILITGWVQSTLELGSKPPEFNLITVSPDDIASRERIVLFSDRAHETICFFVEPHTEYHDGVLALVALLQREYDTIIVFLSGDADKVKPVLGAFARVKETVYHLDPDEFKTMFAYKYPVVLGYRNDRLHFSGSAPFSSRDVETIISLFQRKKAEQ